MDLNVKCKVIKQLLEDNIRENLDHLGYCGAFLSQHQGYDP